MAELSPDLKAGLVRILQADGETTSGSGFIVSESGLIATCSHVVQPEKLQVRGYPRPEKVALIFRANGKRGSARVLPEAWRSADSEDVALLQLEEPLPAGVEPQYLGFSESSSGHAFQTFGFPDFSPIEGVYGDGHILDETTVQGMKVLQVSSPQVTPGFSGAPVLDIEARRIVGMVTSIAAPDKFGRLMETAFVTPTETLISIYPQLVPSDVRPYLGLAAFTEKDAEFFFGRRRLVESLVDALRSRPRFLLVMGPSGSGKSSVVQAGLIPRLREGAVPGSDRWEILVARPGDRPFDQLEACGLEGSSKGLVDAVSIHLKKQAGNERMLLVLDQFEEFLVTSDPKLRQQFWTDLNSLLDSDLPVTVMAAMRDDFYSRFAQEAPLQVMDWIKRGIFPVSASLEPEDLREIIEQPARRVGLSLEEGLAEVIISDVLESCREESGKAGRSTVLPLLEFALTQVWERRDQGYLTHQAYNAVGKVTGSLTAWVDEVCRSLEKEGLGSLTRRIFTDLVNLGDEAQRLPDSRRRRRLDDLCNDVSERESVHRVVQRLADARLVTTSIDDSNVIVEIIHDSLIREWTRLRRWLKKDRSFLAWERELEKESRDWKDTSPDDASKRDEGRLLRGLKLNDAERWLKERINDLKETEVHFIQAGITLRDKEREKEEKARVDKERTRRRIYQGLIAFSFVALLLSGVAVLEWNQANQRADESLALYLASQSQQIKAAYGIDYVRQVLLAVESLRHKETAEGDMALRRSMALLTPLLATLDHNDEYRPQDQPLISPRLRFKTFDNNSVFEVAFSPDGTKALTGGEYGTVRIWNISSGEEIHKLFPGSGVVFSPDGTKALTGSNSGIARIWDVSSGQELYRLYHNEDTWPGAFSLDGTKALTGSSNDTIHNSTVRIWDVSSGQELCKLPHNDEVVSVAFSPDGTKVITGSYNGTSYKDTAVRIWDVSNCQELYKLPHDNPVFYAFFVAFSPDGTKALAYGENITGGQDSVWIWDVSSGQEIHKLSQSYVTAVAFIPDSTKVIMGSGDGTAQIWDVASCEMVCKLAHENEGHDETMVQAVAFSPDGTKAMTGSRDGTARIWDVSSGKEIHRLVHDHWVEVVAFSPDGKKAITGSRDGTARIWDISDSQKVHKLALEGWVSDMAFSPDGTKALTANDHGSIQIWNVSSGQEIHKLGDDDIWGSTPGEEAVAFSPDGKKVLTRCSDGTARIWDVSSGQEVLKLGRESGVYAVTFSPDGTKALTIGQDSAWIWDMASGQEIHELPYGVWGVTTVAFSPDGTKVLTGGIEGTAQIWDVSTGLVLENLSHEKEVYAVAFSPDGTKALTGSHDWTARIWDVASGQEIHKLSHNGLVRDVEFSPDGTKALTGSEDGTAGIWDVSTGQEIHKLDHEDVVADVAFSPNGMTALTGSFDGTARIWDVSNGQELHKLPFKSGVTSVALSPDGTKVLIASDGAWIWPVSDKDLISEACGCIAANFTQEDWKRYKISDVRTCPREGKFNRSLSERLIGVLTGAKECQPCVGSLD